VTFRPAIWYPIAVGLSVVNLGAVGFAARAAEPIHATTHAVLAVVLGLWAQRLRRPGAAHPPRPAAAPDSIEQPFQAHLDAIESDMGALRQELNETQERLDFAERLLAQERDMRRMGPQP
jgi:hypothetical protein